jgi:hypothetical protein
MIYPYTYIAYQVDKYERLVEQSRSRKEMEVRMENWFYWKTLLIQYQQ